MENYLKGKKKVDDVAQQLQSVKRMSVSNTGLPHQDVNRKEISSEDGGPKVECITQDGRITKILVTCTCGEQIELNCQYGP